MKMMQDIEPNEIFKDGWAVDFSRRFGDRYELKTNKTFRYSHGEDMNLAISKETDKLINNKWLPEGLFSQSFIYIDHTVITHAVGGFAINIDTSIPIDGWTNSVEVSQTIPINETIEASYSNGHKSDTHGIIQNKTILTIPADGNYSFKNDAGHFDLIGCKRDMRIEFNDSKFLLRKKSND